MKTKFLIKRTFMLAVLTFSLNAVVHAQGAFKVGIAGLNHDHINGILSEYDKGNVNIVGIAEPSKQLQEKYRKKFHLPDSLFFEDLKTMIIKRKPAIVLGYNAVGNHVDVVEVCAPLGIPVMAEKPLA